jgi:DNA mismatch endonuclease (patch repair protein)
MRVRRSLHRRGLRYRLHTRLSGCIPDVVFPRERVAVFVDGCFWHGCPLHRTYAKANAAWWLQKIEGNIIRDQRTTARLEAEGWHVLRIWAHVDADEAAERIKGAVLARRRKPG